MYFGEITTKLHKKLEILKKFMKKDLTNKKMCCKMVEYGKKWWMVVN